MTSSITSITSSIFADTTVAASGLLAMSACPLNAWHGRRGGEKQPVYGRTLDRRGIN